MSMKLEDTKYQQQVEKLMQFLLQHNMVVDSRVLAKWLKKDHHAIIQAVNRNKNRLEKKTDLDRKTDLNALQEHLNDENSDDIFKEYSYERRTGGRTSVYYQLTERQALILLGAVANGEQRDLMYDMLVDAFIAAKEELLILKNQHQTKLIEGRTDLEQILDERIQENIENSALLLEMRDRLDSLEKTVEKNSPRTLIKQTLGKAKISDLK